MKIKKIQNNHPHRVLLTTLTNTHNVAHCASQTSPYFFKVSRQVCNLPFHFLSLFLWIIFLRSIILHRQKTCNLLSLPMQTFQYQPGNFIRQIKRSSILNTIQLDSQKLELFILSLYLNRCRLSWLLNIIVINSCILQHLWTNLQNQLLVNVCKIH
jgi:hypothetical protein